MPSFKRPLVDLEPVEAHNAQPARVGKRVRISDAAELDAKDVNDEEDSPFEPEEPQSGSEDDGEDDDEYRQREEQYELQHSQAIQRQLTQLGENSPNENGILESVECVNFMCHKHFSVELGPLINFIVGKNGSGKSAILTAITLCLGGKASVTNRGQSLKKFIKEGQESATIIVRIKNGGDNAYRQSEYGESIIVERHFSRSGSSGFKLKNARGRIVSTKKSDLDDITDFYVLQIDNPMNVLSQDLARQFLSTSSPTEKYKFFVKGVQLEQLDQDYRLMEESVNQNAVKLNVYREELKIAEAELEKARKKQKLLDKHDKLNQRRHETRKILVWAIVQNQEMVSL
ncbi:Structural maintenance of chromosomes protein 6 [Ascosphaera atra]|nr:Structural maintenance of chromosomes protein 6 [Ascosphaera atra]